MAYQETYNYSKLRGRIKEVCGTQAALAKHIGLSACSVSKKLNNEIEFTQDEIRDICLTLQLDFSQIPDYFFDRVVKQPLPNG